MRTRGFWVGNKSTVRRWLGSLVPVAVSGLLLAWILRWDGLGAGQLGAGLNPQVLSGFVVVLLAYGAIGLLIEALSLVRTLELPDGASELWMAARIKAASYLALIVHYSLGMGVQSYLLWRRSGRTLGEAAGMVLLLSSLDLLMLLGLALMAAAGSQASAALPVRTLLLLAGGTLALMLLLRSDARWRPLPALRQVPVLRALCELPRAVFLELISLRVLLMASYFAFALGTLRVFQIPVAPAEAAIKMTLVALVNALPIAVAGLGTSQAAFMVLFRGAADPGQLLTCSLAISVGLILLRAGLGLAFAREFAREGIASVRSRGPVELG